jgi:hypothetical protein
MVAALAVLVMGGAGSLAPIGLAFAQTAGTAGPISLGDLFTTDGIDLKPGAEEKLQEAAAKTFSPRGGCAEKAKFKVTVKPGEAFHQEALASARRDVLIGVLAGSPLSSRFEFSGKIGSRDDVQVEYDRMPDREKPKLHTSSEPPKGTKVKAGDQIKVTMVARDDATTWQTGIQRIQLLAQNPGGDELVRAQDYPPVIRANCEGRPEPRTLVVTYTVPSNPPPIVRLRAIAEDFANHHDTDVGEFPTGDWYGTIEFSTEGVTLGVRLTIKDVMDIALEYDGRGNVAGSLVANRSFMQHGDPRGCDWAVTVPNKLRGKLIGSYTPGAEVMSLQLIEPVVAPAPRKDCPGGGYIYSGDSIHGAPQFKSVLQSPRAVGDGTFRSNVEWVTTGSYTNRISLTLRKAQN